MNPIMIIVFVGNLTFTSYRSVKNQTDDSPFHTSTNQRVFNGGAAISQDRLCGACRKLHKRCERPDNLTKIHYGDCLYLEGIGFKIVNDCMGKFKRYKIRTKDGTRVLFKKQTNWIDVWVPTLKDEQQFHRSKGIKQYKVWLVKEIPNEHGR